MKKNQNLLKRKLFIDVRFSFFFIFKTIFYLAEIAEDDLDINTKRAIKEQTERDKRIKLQQEREESARLERIQRQREYNGELITEHTQKQIPVAFELVLETDENTNNIIIEVDLMLVQYMKKHQGLKERKNFNFLKTNLFLLNS